MKTKNIISVALFTCIANSAFSSESYYGIGYGAFDWSNPIVNDDASLQTVILTGGEKYNEYASAEFRLGAGLNTSSVDVNPEVVADTQIDIGVKYLFDFSLKLGIPLKRFYPYASIGYGMTEIEVTNLANSGDYSENDVTYGLGLDISLMDKITVNVEYVNYFNVNASQLRGVQAGLNYTF